MWVEQRKIPFTSRTVADPQLFKGSRVVRTAGREGLDERMVEALYADGKPAATFPHAWTVLQTPVNQLIAVGTRAMLASRGTFAGHEYMMLEATAYYPGPNNFGGGVGPRTAIGLAAQRGVVAVDPSVIPLGSRVYVEGYGYAIAGDTGGAIQGMRIDLCFNTYDEAIHFGRQTVKVYIISQR
jgi:3D (Asp-Asp-Asp) domain-containing protein